MGIGADAGPRHGMSEGVVPFHATAAALPAIKGAYVLVIDIALPVAGLPPGRYLYCGSARGPGGIRARVSRHMRRGKTLRWHVDRLTEAGQVLGAWVFADGDECALVRQLSYLPAPLPGFGSSDCTACVSHLLAWPPEATLPWPGFLP